MFLESSQTEFEVFTPLYLFQHLIFDMLSYSGCYHSPMSRYKHAQVNVIERINFNLAIMLVLFICRCGGQHILVFIEYNIKYIKEIFFV